jgi:hypothetical protein
MPQSAHVTAKHGPSFDTKSEAERWAFATKAEILDGVEAEAIVRDPRKGPKRDIGFKRPALFDLFILRYIDEVDLRMAIEAQLNKIELANRFTRAVAVGSPRDFIFALQEDQQVAESCNRLIKNAIICWNPNRQNQR